MKLFLAIIFAWSTAWSKTANKTNFDFEDVLIESSHPGIFAISVKDYQDIRIDSDLDGKVDLWRIKTKLLEVTIHYKSSMPVSFHLKKMISGNQYKEVAIIKSKSGRLSLVKSIVRPAYILNGSVDGYCPKAKGDKTLDDVTKAAEDVKNVAIQNNIYSYIDDSCLDIPNGFQNILLTALEDINSSGTSADKNTFSQCINSERTISELKNPSKDLKVSLDLVSTSFIQNIQKISTTPSVEGSFKIKCKQNPDAKKLNGTYEEGSDISLAVPNNWGVCKNKDNPGSSCGNPKDDLAILLRHELLHKSGLKDEAVSDKIANFCSGRSTYKKGNDPSIQGVFIDKAHVNSSQNATAETKGANVLDSAIEAQASTKASSQSSRAPASDTGGGSDGVNMVAEIAKAEAVIPSAEKLAQTKVDKSPEGIQAAAKESIAESTPVLRMANQVMGVSNTPALASSSGNGGGSSYNSSEVAKSDIAAPSSYEPSSSSSGSSSSDTSSSRRYQRTSRYESSNETIASSEGPKVITSKSNSGLAPGERVVEEIDLTKGTNYRAANVPTRGQQGNTREVSASRTTAASREPASAVPPAPANQVGEVVAPGPINTGSSGSLGSFSNASEVNTSGSTGNNRRTSGNRGPASSGSTRNSATSSREEVVTFLSNGSYSQTKNKLRESGFINTLKSNKVTIIDLYGNSFGASRGDVIFLDDGNKFVRQK